MSENSFSIWLQIRGIDSTIVELMDRKKDLGDRWLALIRKERIEQGMTEMERMLVYTSKTMDDAAAALLAARGGT